MRLRLRPRAPLLHHARPVVPNRHQQLEYDHDLTRGHVDDLEPRRPGRSRKQPTMRGAHGKLRHLELAAPPARPPAKVRPRARPRVFVHAGPDLRPPGQLRRGPVLRADGQVRGRARFSPSGVHRISQRRVPGRGFLPGARRLLLLHAGRVLRLAAGHLRERIGAVRCGRLCLRGAERCGRSRRSAAAAEVRCGGRPRRDHRRTNVRVGDRAHAGSVLWGRARSCGAAVRAGRLLPHLDRDHHNHHNHPHHHAAARMPGR
mmetsp:Transcript_19368/g.48476  ORF Transcript_19368/g.48476 Transcript_19368/m.48476 type:complete len:260 (+) Transcript_19368:275-1054(+)